MFMILTLLWLTVSMPIVYAAQQLSQVETGLIHDQPADMSTGDEDNPCNPFGNNTEEKAPSGSITEEYHTDDHSDLFHMAELISAHKRCHAPAEYVAFHGEMLCPPPNRA